MRPLAVRIWRLDELDLPARVVALPVVAGETAGEVWLAGPGATDLGAWPRGTYRFDVVLDGGIVRLLTTVPTPGRLVARSEPLPMGPPPDLATGLAAGRTGLFAISGPELVRIAAAPGPALGEDEAWRRAGCVGGDACAVGRLVSRTASAVGVLLEPGAVPARAVLEQVGPVARVPRTLPEVIELGAAGEAPRRAVVLRVDSPGPLSSGLYRFTVAWRTAAGAERETSWHVEIVPPGA